MLRPLTVATAMPTAAVTATESAATVEAVSASEAAGGMPMVPTTIEVMLAIEAAVAVAADPDPITIVRTITPLISAVVKAITGEPGPDAEIRTARSNGTTTYQECRCRDQSEHYRPCNVFHRMCWLPSHEFVLG